MPSPQANTSPQPIAGVEKTQEQVARMSEGGIVGVGTTLAELQGYGKPPSGTYTTYRRMRQDPTIAMARAIAMSPIRMANWSYEADDDAPEGAREFIQDQFDKLRSKLLHDMLYALDYGWQAFEKVLEIVNREGQQRLGYRKVKPLIPDLTEILYEKANPGIFSGLKQGRVMLEASKSFVFTNDMEGTDMYGRSRMENLRKTVWPASSKLFDREGMYVQKASGIIPMIQYPLGESKDKSGNVTSHFELAQRLLDRLGSGKGVTMPNIMAKWAEQLANRGVTDPKALQAWMITFLESAGNHGAEFVQLGERYDKLKFRGWLVPERTAQEGTHGTKAEAEAHADVALMVAELTNQDIVRHVNWYLIDPLLAWNWGDEAKGKVKVVPEKLVDEEKALLRSVMKQVLSGNIDALNDLLDMDAVVEMLGLPKAEESVALTTGVARPDVESAMLDGLARMGNDVNLDDTRQVAALARYRSALVNSNGKSH
jgi:hypothetical protein